jgi:VPDSG-CTERM motif
MNKLKYLAAIVIAIAGLGLQQAKADAIQSILDTGPGGSTGINYGTVTVSLTGQTATITFEANTALDYHFIDSSAAAVQVNASTFSAAIVNDTAFDHFSSGDTVNGFGTFNLVINNTDGWADRVNTIIFTVTNTSATLWSSASDVLAFNGHLQNGGPFDAAAHVATAGGSLTFFVAEHGAGVNVPDGGATVMLLGTALGALGMARRFLKR